MKNSKFHLNFWPKRCGILQFKFCLKNNDNCILKFHSKHVFHSGKVCDKNMPTFSKFCVCWFCWIVFRQYCTSWVSFSKMIVSKSKFFELACWEPCIWLEKKKVVKIVNVWETTTNCNKWGRQNMFSAEATTNIHENCAVG